MRRALSAAIAATAVALVIVSAGFGSRSGVTLKATVGPGFTITLTQGGHRVTSLMPGTYRMVVVDRSQEHNFALRSAGKTLSLSSVGWTGTKTVSVKLGKGTWAYYCAPHAEEMRGTFRVT